MIIVNLGDKYDVNFQSVEHMEQVRDTYKRVVKRGSVPGSATFTPETIIACRRRLFILGAEIGKRK